MSSIKPRIFIHKRRGTDYHSVYMFRREAPASRPLLVSGNTLAEAMNTFCTQWKILLRETK